ncbi:MAG TPA: FtsX-like permease family protein [Vicinamibacterales bacterium]|nr:FtsX-like permease family protein [Vicinamibacterales bacterium]
MRFVLLMAAREMRASWHRLLFFFICIAIGVGAIVALRSVIQSVRNTLVGEARSLITADAIITSNQALKPEVLEKIDQRLQGAGASSINAVELATMARPAGRAEGRARMVELKAVEQEFPYYGRIRLAGDLPFSHALLENFGVLVRPELLAQLDVKIGDALSIGSQRFTIRGVILSEPGRRLGAFTIGPRVFIDLADLEKTGLTGFGSRVSRQRLLKVPDAAFDKLIVDLRADFANEFARVRSYKGAEEDLGEEFTRAENYFSLVGLVIVILGGIGVASVTGVFVQQKMKSIAVLKCVGARSSQLLAVYVAQVGVLGLAGSLLGVLLAELAMRAIPLYVVAAVQGVEISYALTWPAVVQGVGIGLLVSLLFSLVPLLDVRHVKPSLLLRDEARVKRPDLTQIVVTILVVAGLVGLTVWQAGSLRIGSMVAAGFAATAIALHFAGTLLLRAITPLARSRSFALRHAVLQLSRPGSQMRIVLLAVGLGSFFIIGVRSLQQNLIDQFAVRMTADSPDMFLLDIQRDQVEAIQAAIAAHMDPGAKAPPLVPVLRGRVVGVAGREVNLENYEDVRGRGSLGREYTITYRDKLESNEKILAGKMWEPSPSDEPEVSIEQFISESFKINVGDTVRFDVLGRVIAAKVTSVRAVEWSQSRAGGFMFLFRPGVLEKAPHSYIGFLRGPKDLDARARMQAALVGVAPNVSVIDGREILDAITSVIDNVTLAVTVVGTLVVLSGLMILIGAVAMTKFRRVYEAAIFKTLGATRRLIATVLLLEYGLLGVLAGSVGAGGAIVLTWAISKYALEIPFKPLIGLSAIGVVITTLLVAAIGVISSWEVLQRKPLATLRAE